MAKPIRNTPILQGNDALIFNMEISQRPSLHERRKERQRIASSVDMLRAMISQLPK